MTKKKGKKKYKWLIKVNFLSLKEMPLRQKGSVCLTDPRPVPIALWVPRNKVPVNFLQNNLMAFAKDL